MYRAQPRLRRAPAVAMLLAAGRPFDDSDHLEGRQIAQLIDVSGPYEDFGDAAREVLGDRPRVAARRANRPWPRHSGDQPQGRC